MSDMSTVLGSDRFGEVAEHVESSSNTGMSVSVIDNSTLMLSSPSTIATVKWRPEWNDAVVQFSVRKVSKSKDGATRDRYLVVAGHESAADTDPAETVTRYPEPVKVIAGFDEEVLAYALIFNMNQAISQSASRRDGEPGWVESTSHPRVIRKIFDIAGTLAWITVGVAAVCAAMFGATVAKHYGDLYVGHAHESALSSRP